MYRQKIYFFVSFFLMMLTSGCANAPLSAVSDDWRPLNIYQNSIQPIPLKRVYYFHAMEIDGSLKGLLERWSSDNSIELVYGIESDFTLTTEVSAIKKTELSPAIAMLNDIYAKSGARISVEDGKIVVSEILLEQTAVQKK